MLILLPLSLISECGDSFGADGGIRTPDQLITNQLLWPTELHRQLVCPDLGLQIYGEILIPQNFRQQNFKNSSQSFTEP